MVVVIHDLNFSKPVDAFIQPLQAEGLPLLARQPGCKDFHFVKTADDRATVILVWQDGEAAARGAQAFGPTWFAQHMAPHLASEQERRMGPAVVSYHPA